MPSSYVSLADTHPGYVAANDHRYPDAGLADADAGRVRSHADVVERVKRRYPIK